MKATDLMIGDWVCVYSNDRTETHQFRVNEIVERGVYDSHKGFVEEKDIEPIPLTPEILGKNGIKLFSTYTCPYRDGEWEEGELEEAMKHYPMYVYQTLNPYITFVICPNEQELKVCSSNYKTRVEKKEEIIYVHELQRALRLCKIEKEIVL